MSIDNLDTPKLHDIERLCDQFNTRIDTPVEDYRQLLTHVVNFPKECAPIKGKVLQYIQLQASNSKSKHFGLLADIYARAIVIVRKTVNKDEGPVDLWKKSLFHELTLVENTIDILYSYAGLKANRVLQRSDTSEINEFQEDKVNDSEAEFEAIIDLSIFNLTWSLYKVSALIQIPDLEIPIPASTIVRIISKLTSIRWKEAKKKPNSLIKAYIFSKEKDFINLFIKASKILIRSSGSSIIHLLPVLNAAVFSALESTLHEPIKFDLLDLIEFILTHYGLNINLDSSQLESLFNNILLKEYDNKKYTISSLQCLSNLFRVYHRFLSADVEYNSKNFVIHKCISIYRDFDELKGIFADTECRKQLLETCHSLSNQQRATSTSELALNIFELALSHESDANLRAKISTLMKSFSSNPVIVPHFQVYNLSGRPMLSKDDV